MDSATVNGLRDRSRVDELMDQPGLDPLAHGHALRGLERINTLSRSESILWPSIARLARASTRCVRVLDLACGGGDVTSALAARAMRHRLNLTVDGCDYSPTAVSLASAKGENSTYFHLDVLRDPFPEGYDVLCCSLFLHHLDEEEAVHLLQKMSTAAGHLVLINDLSRSQFGYLLAWVGCHVLSRSYVVRTDGPASVLGAFTPAEALRLAKQAGLVGSTVTRRWPARFLLSWSRS